MPTTPGTSEEHTEGVRNFEKHIPLPQGTKTHREINTLVLREKKKLLSEEKIPVQGYQIRNDELILHWNPLRKNKNGSTPQTAIEIGDSEEEGDVSNLVAVRRVIHIPLKLDARDYSRRVLVNNDGVFGISMSRNIRKVDLTRSSTTTVQKADKGILVQDACASNGYLIIGTKENISVMDEPRSESITFPAKSGLTCLATMGSESGVGFVAGTDVGVSLYSYLEGLHFKERRLLSLKAKISAITSRQKEVIMASSRKIQLFDVKDNQVISEGDISNPIYQMKVNPIDPNILAVEVLHLHRQIHLYDLRMPLFGTPPIIEMGYCSATAGNSKETKSRFSKGDFLGNFYVRGYNDGTVNLFDIRNVQKIVSSILTKRDSPVVHCVFSEWKANKVLAIGKNTLSYIHFN